MKTNKKGITLIALVITIIILLILAAVAIQLALGDNGLIGKAREGQGKQTVAEATDKFKTLQAAAWADYVASEKDSAANHTYVEALNRALTATTHPNIKGITSVGTFQEAGALGTYTLATSTVKLKYDGVEKLKIDMDTNGNVTYENIN